MSYLREVTVGGAFPPFVAFQALFGFVPNVFRAQTLLPRVIEAEAAIACALLLEERDLSRIQKASMSLAISAAYGDAYWVTGYYQLLRSIGVPGDTLDRIVINDHQADLSTRDQALLDFARKLAKRGPWLSGEDIAELRSRGSATVHPGSSDRNGSDRVLLYFVQGAGLDSRFHVEAGSPLLPARRHRPSAGMLGDWRAPPAHRGAKPRELPAVRILS